MRFSFAVVLSALSAAVVAQTTVNLSDLPKCAQTCIGNGLSSTGCNSVDINCICHSTKWISDLSCCISKSCNAAEQATTVTFAQQLCLTYGVTLSGGASCNGVNSTSTNSTGTSTTSSSAAAASQTKNAAAGREIGFGLAAAGLVAALL